MAGRIYMKKGDRLPVIDAQLCDRNGPVNLTGATVNFIMKSPAGVVKVNAICAIVDAVNGRVQYSWGLTDTDTANAYRSEFQVTFPGGLLETFPNDDYVPAIITEDLA
jgi:hypothetical protein